MHILFIGYSGIVQRRVLPAVLTIPEITDIDIASLSSAQTISDSNTFTGDVFDDYNAALSKSKADIVYISTVNSKHAEWTEKALQAGYHVIVDKPSCTSFEIAQALVALAKKMNLCLTEASVYSYHPQIQLIKDTFAKLGSSPTRLTAILSFPPFKPENFRYKEKAGGGALWDTGPYAVSTGRLFFNEEPEDVFCRICSRGGEDDIETSYSMLATYTGGRSLIGHFGFDTEYRNYLNILGPDASVTVERIYTTPADMENEIHIRQHNESAVIKAPRADSFSIYMQTVFDNIKKGDYQKFYDELLSDASVLDRLRSAALSEG